MYNECITLQNKHSKLNHAVNPNTVTVHVVHVDAIKDVVKIVLFKR